MAESIIYFIERQSDKAIKIGTTHNLKPRLLSLKLEHGEIKLLGIINGNVVKEKLLHWIFKDHRIAGYFINPYRDLLEASRRLHVAMRHLEKAGAETEPE